MSISYILAIDVGKGTEDILLIEENKINDFYNLSNSIQIVLPSTAQLMYNSLARVQRSEKLVFEGTTMGGEPWNKLIYEISKKFPNLVYMTRQSALSLKYNLEYVQSMGINIIENSGLNNPTGRKFITNDIDWNRIKAIVEGSQIQMKNISKVLLACQDHGLSPDTKKGPRDFRITAIYRRLDQQGLLQDLLLSTKSIPDFLPRHQSIASSALTFFSHLKSEDVFVMDSSPAVTLGVLNDENSLIEHFCVVNVGNGHTVVTFFSKGIVKAVYETHTGKLSLDTFEKDLKYLVSNKLRHSDVIKQGGHGIYLREKFSDKIKFEDYFPFFLIGPNRQKLNSLEVKFSHPGGNMMMAGPIGLLRAYKKKSFSQIR